MATRNAHFSTTARAIFVLAMIGYVLGFAPVTVQAQAQSGAYEFPLGRSNATYTQSMNIVLLALGKGQNRWEIPANATVTFITTVGCLEDTCGWGDLKYPVLYFDGARTPAPGACDIASYFAKVAQMYGVPWHRQFKHGRPLYGVEEAYWVSIWNPGQDMTVTNPYPHAIAFMWTVEGTTLRIWMEGIDGTPLTPPQIVQNVNSAVLSQSIDESELYTDVPIAFVGSSTQVPTPVTVAVNPSVSFEQLPFITDKRPETSTIMPNVYKNDRSVTTRIVIHEAWLEALCNTTREYAMAVDGPRLVAGWKAKNGWDKPGYAAVAKWTDVGDFAPVDMMAGPDTLTHGVKIAGEYVNGNSIHIAFVGWPCDGAMTQQQLNSMVAMTRALMIRYNVPISRVVAHKELGGHADPRGVDMNWFRCLVQNSASCSQAELSLPTGSVVYTDTAPVDLPIDFIGDGIEPEDMMIPRSSPLDISQVTNTGDSQPILLLAVAGLVALMGKQTRKLGLYAIVLAVILFLLGGG